MKTNNRLIFLGAIGLTVLNGVRHLINPKPIGPCSPELEFRCDVVNENRAAIDTWRKSHPDAKITDWEIWLNHLRGDFLQEGKIQNGKLES